MQARFVRGHYTTVQYTPQAAVSAGDVVVIGDKCYIAHHDIAAGELGELACGGGIYEVAADSGTSTEIDMGKKVYWDDSGDKAGEDSSGATPLGWAAGDKSDDEDTVLVEHGAF